MIRALVFLALVALSGCFVRLRPPVPHIRRAPVVAVPVCPPGTHWDGHRCHHNGKGRHHHHDGRDYDD